MLESDLINIIKDIQIKKCEMQNIELKSAHGGAPKVFDTLSSFSNQANGGIIIFGISEREDYFIQGVYDPQDLQIKITQQANQMEPTIRPLFTVANVDDKIVVSAEIPELPIANRPCFYKGAGIIKGSYVRVGEADMPMTEYEVYSYKSFNERIEDELRPVKSGLASAIDERLIDNYIEKLKLAEKNRFAELTIEEIKILSGLLIDKTKEDTLLNVMLFGKIPQANFPQLCITAVVVAGTEMGDVSKDNERFIDNKKITGTIPEMLEEAVDFIRRNMKTRTIIDNNGVRNDKYEYPLVAIRELVVNALVHRDYSIHTESCPIRIVMFSDRIEIENPGGLYGRLTLDMLGKHMADIRNPHLVSALEILGGTENRLSGIPTVIRLMKEYKLPEPKFENSRGQFKVTLYNSYGRDLIDNKRLNTQMKNLKDEILKFCSVERTREEIIQYFGFTSSAYVMKKYIQPLIKDGSIAMTLPNTPKSKNQRYYTIK